MEVHGRPPSVSVVMATHNGERFVAEQLESLAAQAWLPFELVVADDASTDATTAIVEEFASAAPFPVRLLRGDAPVGHGEAFFRAMRACTGEVIAFCDQDDVWHPNKVERCASMFEQHRSLALLVHSGRVVDEELRPVGVQVPKIRRTRVVGDELLSPWFVERGFAMVIPRWLTVLDDVESRPSAFHRNEDRPMDHDEWACFLGPAVGPVALLAEELVDYRRHRQNASVLPAPGLPAPGFLRRVRGGVVRRSQLGGSGGMRAFFDIEARRTAYTRLARQSRAGAHHLEGVAARVASTHGELVSGLRSRAVLYRHAASVLEDRATALAAPTRRRRMVSLARLARRRGYQTATKGGLGILAVPADLLAVLAGRRAPTPAE